MDELLKVQPCSNERSSSIRFVYDKIRVHVRGLEALGVTPEQYGSLLIPILGSFRFDYEYDYEYEIRQAKRMLYAYAIPY